MANADSSAVCTYTYIHTCTYMCSCKGIPAGAFSLEGGGKGEGVACFSAAVHLDLSGTREAVALHQYTEGDGVGVGVRDGERGGGRGEGVAGDGEGVVGRSRVDVALQVKPHVVRGTAGTGSL